MRLASVCGCCPFRTVLHQLTEPMCCVGGLQSRTCFQRSRLALMFSTRPETASTRYQAVAALFVWFMMFVGLGLADAFLQLRNSLRFLLGNLEGFDPRVQAVACADMHYIDQYMLHLLHKYSVKVSCSPSLSLPALCRSHVDTVEHSLCLCVCLFADDRCLQ